MVRSKVEDMSEQHSEILATVDAAAAEPPKVAMVVVSDGYGVTKAFRGLGARVVGGGQTNNPSVQDIADAVRSVGAPTVIVMPNNGNIVMAAERAQELLPERDVRVLKTRTLGQGLAAAFAFDEDGDPDAVFDEMGEALEDAVTIEITTASRDVRIGDVDVAEGQFIALVDGTLASSGDDPQALVRDLVAEHAADAEVATLFYAPNVTVEEAQRLADALDGAHAELEVEVHPGAPDLYPYLLLIE